MLESPADPVKEYPFYALSISQMSAGGYIITSISIDFD